MQQLHFTDCRSGHIGAAQIHRRHIGGIGLGAAAIEHMLGQGIGNAADYQAVPLLEGHHSVMGIRIIFPIDRKGIAQFLQRLLQAGYARFGIVNPQGGIGNSGVAGFPGIIAGQNGKGLRAGKPVHIQAVLFLEGLDGGNGIAVICSGNLYAVAQFLQPRLHPDNVFAGHAAL